MAKSNKVETDDQGCQNTVYNRTPINRVIQFPSALTAFFNIYLANRIRSTHRDFKYFSASDILRRLHVP